ncbi:MAG: ribosome maturation factor RimM [Pseudomonadota bacterium]
MAGHDPDAMLHVGTITGAYGIKGWVKVFALTEERESIFDFSRWYLADGAAFHDVEFVDGRLHGKGLIAQLRDVDSRTAAEALRGREIWVDARELPDLDDGDFYWHELAGMEVWTEFKGREILLGRVDHLLETGANDVLVLKACPGSVDQRQRLLPYTPGAVVQRVRREEKRIDVDWHPED